MILRRCVPTWRLFKGNDILLSANKGFSLFASSFQKIGPFNQDLILTDINEKMLELSVSPTLGIGYLTEAKESPTFPVEGFMLGDNLRGVVNLTVQWPNLKPLNVFFIVNTGSPFTYLSVSTLKAFGLFPNTPGFGFVNLHGRGDVKTFLSPTGSHFKDLNILGSHAMAALKLKMLLNYANGTVSLVDK